VNIVHKKDCPMQLKSSLITSIFIIAAIPAFADPSDSNLALSMNHSGQASNHSARAASHGSATAASAVSTIAAVPIIAFGSTLTISGAALQQVGNSALDVGSTLATSNTPKPYAKTAVKPNGAPTLD
jgi:hypothetical protein